MFIRRDEDDLDRIFRQRLKQAEEPFPGHLWEGIRQRSGRKKGIPPFWFVAALIVSGALGFGLYYSDLSAPSGITSHTAQPNTIVNPDNTGNSAVDNEVISENAIASSSNESVPVPHVIPHSPNSPNNKTVKSINESQRGQEAEISTSRAPYHAGEEVESETLTSTGFQITPEATPPVMEISGDWHSNHIESQPENSETPPSEEVAINPSQPATNSANPVEVGAEEHTNETPLPSATENVPLQIQSLPNLPQANSTIHPFAAGIYASVYQARRLADSVNSNYVSSQSENETLQSPAGNARGFAVGLGVQYSLSKWAYLSSGIEYSQMKDQTRYRDLFLVGQATYVNQIDTSWVYTETDTTLTIGTATVPSDSIWTTSQKTATVFNQYQSFNIPLTAGFSWSHKRFFAGLEAGPVFRLGKVYSGAFRYNDHLLTSEASLADDPYMLPQIQEGRTIFMSEVYSKWNIDWHAALRLGYTITPRMAVQGAVQYRMTKNTIKHDEISDHRIVMPGVSFGLYYHF